MLSGQEFFNNYLNKIFSQDDLTAEQKQAVINSWNKILSHIENFMAIMSIPNPPVKVIPDFTGAGTGSIMVSPNAGTNLSGTGSILTQTMLISGVEYTPEMIANITRNFDLLFAHIVEKTEVDINGIAFSGTINISSPPPTYGNVFNTTGKVI